MPLKLNFHVEAVDEKKSLGEFLSLQNLSKKSIVALKHRGGRILVDGFEATTRYVLGGFETVSVEFADEPVSEALVPVAMDFEIAYEDDFLLVVNKEAGIPVIPTGHHDIGLGNGILHYYNKIGISSTIHFVNRLDKDTSGLLIVAKYRHIHHLMTQDIMAVSRKYYAFVEGKMNESRTINAKIARLSVPSVKREVDETGQVAVTHFEPVKNYTEKTLLRCTLETGRTHQIRVHASYIGHPILNDSLYGNGIEGDMQLLHSYFLEFRHPVTDEILTFETAVPERFGIY